MLASSVETQAVDLFTSLSGAGLRGISFGSVHGAILSRFGASANPGTVQPSLPHDEALKDEFVLPRTGAKRQGEVAFAVPDDSLSQLSLHYYHDQYAPIGVPLKGGPPDSEAGYAEPERVEGHDILTLGVMATERHDDWRNTDAWASGEAVFAIPEAAERVERVTYMPQFRGIGISAVIRPTLRFPIQSGACDEGNKSEVILATIADVPTLVVVHALDERDAFTGHHAEEGEILLLLEGGMGSDGDTGSMLPISNRFRLSTSHQEAVAPIAAYVQRRYELEDPFCLPPGERRDFTLLYRLEASVEILELDYSRVSTGGRAALDGALSE